MRTMYCSSWQTTQGCVETTATRTPYAAKEQASTAHIVSTDPTACKLGTVIPESKVASLRPLIKLSIHWITSV